MKFQNFLSVLFAASGMAAPTPASSGNSGEIDAQDLASFVSSNPVPSSLTGEGEANSYKSFG
jgi:hypothetical protein